MILIKKTTDLEELLAVQKKAGKTIGFAPTMGALHAGHISLIKASKKENDISVCSIFINPKQFNDPKDFEKYPVTIEKDIYLLEEAGCDFVFIPDEAQIYPAGEAEAEHFDLGYLETILEGKYRPGHFQGVCKVVYRLLTIVRPDKFYLGQKDYQQCMVIKKLIDLSGWNKKINVRICPTLREPDGLAMSSRNMRLNEEERKNAVIISKILLQLKEKLSKGSLMVIKQEAADMLVQNGCRVDYVEIADAETLEQVNDWDGKRKLVALTAAFINNVRLIDNMLLN